MSNEVRPRGNGLGDFIQLGMTIGQPHANTQWYGVPAVLNNFPSGVYNLEASVQLPLPYDALLRGVYFNIYVNDLDADALTIQLRKDGADFSPAIVYPFGVTGQKNNGPLMLPIAAGSLLAYRGVTGGTSSSEGVAGGGYLLLQRVL